MPLKQTMSLNNTQPVVKREQNGWQFPLIITFDLTEVSTSPPPSHLSFVLYLLYSDWAKKSKSWFIRLVVCLSAHPPSFHLHLQLYINNQYSILILIILIPIFLGQDSLHPLWFFNIPQNLSLIMKSVETRKSTHLQMSLQRNTLSSVIYPQLPTW